LLLGGGWGLGVVGVLGAGMLWVGLPVGGSFGAW